MVLKPPLIEGVREWSLFGLLTSGLFLLMLGWHYLAYKRFVSCEKIFLDAEVLLQYTKERDGRSYEVLKLLSHDGHTFYSTSKEPIKNLTGRTLSMLLFPKRVTFWEYLSTPYIPSVILGVRHERSARMALFETIKEQHDEPWMQELYGALFLALPISRELRERVTLLGINHLLALSGFHMGFLWLIVYGALSWLYRPLQRRFFPWRHRLLDVGAFTIGVLGLYLLFTGIPPSLLRAYAMVVVGWAALLFGVEILSFSFLAFCVAILLALFPAMLLSVAFWLSVAGLFFIYLFLAWTEGWPKWGIYLSLNLWIYLAMLPVVHLLFPQFGPYQLLSIPLTLVFGLFYPLSMLLHLVGYGGVADGWIMALLQWPPPERQTLFLMPLWLFGIYLALSLLALFNRIARYLQVGFLLLFFLFLVQQVA